tara:strand:- start:312 stop:515 length:204 start_codon:yes stop_codon:yes gene_type:complete
LFFLLEDVPAEVHTLGTNEHIARTLHHGAHFSAVLVAKRAGGYPAWTFISTTSTAIGLVRRSKKPIE